MGHMAMLDRGYKHRWGIGRHFHGSQIFDYWTDPAGFHVEHFVDRDLVNADSPTLNYPFGRDPLLQWGPAFPGLQIPRILFADILRLIAELRPPPSTA